MFRKPMSNGALKMSSSYKISSFLLVSLCTFQVHSQFSQTVNNDLLCEVPGDSPNPRRTLESNCTDCFPGFDLSTDCSTCEGESLQCVEGEQNCGVGYFTFSAMFHSYENPNHLCAECNQSTIVTCGAASANNGIEDCGLRFMYCLRPYGSDIIDVPLPGQPTLSPGTDDITFTDDFITQIGGGARGNNIWNRSNPFTQELRLWPGRVQFYIVVFHFRSGLPGPNVVNRFQIDLELSITSAFTERKTYYGLQNLTQFEMSFKIAGQCSDNYYGPQCDVFCSEVEGQFTCDSEGIIVCVNSNLNPATNCTECLVVGQDPDNNCGITATGQCLTGRDPSTNCTECLITGRDRSTNCTECLITGRDPARDCVSCLPGMYQMSEMIQECVTVPSSVLVPLYSAIGTLSCCVLLLVIIIFALVACYYHKAAQGTHSEEVPRAENIEMTQNQVYGVSSTTAAQKAQGAVDKIEMTQNQVYGRNTHVDSGVTNLDGTGDDPQDNPDYNYI